MKRLLFILALMAVGSFATQAQWTGDFAISTGANSWVSPIGIPGLNSAWKFQGTADMPGPDSKHKYIKLNCVGTPMVPGDISSGSFDFRIITDSAGIDYSWGGDFMMMSTEWLNVNMADTISCPNYAYEPSYNASFTAMVDNVYYVLFPAVPNGAGEGTPISILEFNGQPEPVVFQEAELDGDELRVKYEFAGPVFSDQVVYIKYIYEGESFAFDAKVLSEYTDPGENMGEFYIPYAGHTEVQYYLFVSSSGTQTSVENNPEDTDAFELFTMDDMGVPFIFAQNTMATIAVSADSTCQGDLVYFMDENYDPLNNYEYNIWYGDASSNTGITGLDPAYPEMTNIFDDHQYAGTGDYLATVEVVDLNTMLADTFEIVLNKHNDPGLEPTYKYYASFMHMGSTPLCLDDSIDFLVSGGYQWTWKYGDGNTSNDQFPTYAYSDFGVFDPYLIINNSCGRADTAFFQSVQIGDSMQTDLAAFPSIAFTGNDSICPGEEVLFFDQAFDYSNGYMYDIIYGDGDSTIGITMDDGTLGGIMARHTYNTPGTYNYEFRAYGDCHIPVVFIGQIKVVNGFGNTSYYVSNSTNEGSNPVCPNDPVEFDIVGGVSYEWHFGDGYDDTLAFTTHTYAGATTYNAYVLATNNCGAQDSITTVVVTDNTNFPMASFSYDMMNPCRNELSDFYYNGPKNEPDYQEYMWTWGTGDTLYGDGVEIAFPDFTSYNVSLTVSNGCGDDVTSDMIWVYEPMADIYVNDQWVMEGDTFDVCPGDVVFETSVMDDWTRIEWYFGNGDNDLGNNELTSTNYVGFGYYTAKLLIDYQCGGPDTMEVVINVTNTIWPSVMLDYSPMFDICPLDDVSFLNWDDEPGYTYTWYFGDGVSSNDAEPVYAYSDTGFYKVRAQITNSCGNTEWDSVYVDITGDNPITANLWGMMDACPGEDISFSTNTEGTADVDMGDGTIYYNVEDWFTHAYDMPGTYTAYVTVTNGCGYTDTTSWTTEVDYNPMMRATSELLFAGGDVDPYQNSINICPGEEVAFQIGMMGWGDSYKIIYGDGQEEPINNYTVHTYNTPGTYDVMLVAFEDCGNDTAYKEVVVGGNVPVQAMLTSVPDTVCPGETVYFFDEEDDNYGLYTYDIYFGDGADQMNMTDPQDSILNTLAAHSYGILGDYNYTFVAENSCGITDTVFGTVVVDNNAGRTPFYYVGNSTYNDNDDTYNPACVGDFVKFEVAGGTQQIWHFDDGSLADTGQTVYHSYISALNYNAFVEIENSCGRKDTVYTTVEVSPSGSLPEVSLQANTYEICAGDTVFFEANADSYYQDLADMNNSYDWNFADGSPTAPGRNVFHVFGEAGSYNVACNVTNGCGTTIEYITINVNAPNVYLGDDFGICAGIDYELDAGTWDTYLWNDASNGQTLTVSAEGHYWVEVSDADGCVARDSIYVSTYAPPAAEAGTDVNSCGGSKLLSATGGTTFEWSNGANTQSISVNPMATTKYYVSVYDGPGCYNVDSVSVIVNTVFADAGTDENICEGETQNLIASGGSTYSWSSGHTTASIDVSPIMDTQYWVTVDNGTCQGVDEVWVFVSMAPTVDAGMDQYPCYGDTIWLWGNTQYQYWFEEGNLADTLAWDTSWNSIPFEATGSISLVVEGKDSPFGCSVYDTLQVFAGPPMSLDVDWTDVSCGGFADGTASLTINGGLPPFSISWTSGHTAQSIGGLSGGFYYVDVYDNNSCWARDSVDIYEPMSLMAFTNAGDVTCGGDNDGFVEVSANGGTSPYSYAWSNGPTVPAQYNINGGNYEVTVSDLNGCEYVSYATVTEYPVMYLTGTTVTDPSGCGTSDGWISVEATGGLSPLSYNWTGGSMMQSISGLDAGVYSLTFSDSWGCSKDTAFTLTTVGSPTISLVSASDPSCAGNWDGDIDISVSGGSTPYTFAWSNGASTEDLTGIGFGQYNLTLTDAGSCTAGFLYELFEPQMLFAWEENQQDITCSGDADGYVDVSVDGGTLPYSFAWSNGATTEDLSGLSIGGAYDNTVTDANGCEYVVYTSVTEPAPLGMSMVSITDPTCGIVNGEISVMASGGTGMYSYNWSNGGSSDYIFNLAGGNYDLTLTDDNGCEYTDFYTLTDEGVPAISLVGFTDPSCFMYTDGDIDISVSGGTSPYSFDWNSGGYLTEDISGVSSGMYYVDVTDMNMCFVTDTFFLTEPMMLMAWEISSGDISCFGDANGYVDVSVEGGTAPYSYAWSNGATTQDVSGLSTGGSYDNTVTDINGCSYTVYSSITEPTAIGLSFASVTDPTCGLNNGEISVMATGGAGSYVYNWSNMDMGDYIYDLLDGSYDLTVTDLQGCEYYDGFVLSGTSAPSVSLASSTDPTCYLGSDGAININVTGGATPYTYYWSNGATTQDITGVSGGSYSVEVYDDAFCYTSATYVLTDPAYIDAYYVAINDVCYGETNGSVDMSVSGGTAPYTIAWNNGASTEDLTGLTSGQYYPTITDANGCVQTPTFADVAGNPQLFTSLSDTNVSCYGLTDAALYLGASGGSGGYSFAWSNGESTQNLYFIGAGEYSVIVTDAAGCNAYDTATVTEPAQIVVNATTTPISCSGDSDGAISIAASGGAGSLYYNWNTGATSSSLSALTGGTYTISVTDDNSCLSTQSIALTNPMTLGAGITAIDPTCGGNNGQMTANVTGGTAPYSYAWTGSLTGQTVSNLAAGTYSLTVTDDHGCTATAMDSVTAAEAISILATYDSLVCGDEAVASINLTVSGGSAPYSYNWSDSTLLGASLTDLDAGTYTVTVEDANNCAANKSIVISSADVPTINVGEPSRVVCAGNSITLNATGDGTITWNGGITNGQSVSPTASTTYKATVTSTEGCTNSAGVTAFVIDCGTDDPTDTEGTGVIAGGLLYSKGALDSASAKVKLFKKEWFGSEVSFKPVGEYIIGDNGTFLFTKLQEGSYIMKAEIVDPTVYPTVLTSYYDKKYSWFNADSVAVGDGDVKTVSFNMFEIYAQPVTAKSYGRIGGNINFQDPTKSYLAAGEPVPGAEIYLEQEPNDDPVGYTISNESDGSFEFRKVQESDSAYSIYVDIEGVEELSTYNGMKVSESDSVFSDLAFIVDTAAGILGTKEAMDSILTVSRMSSQTYELSIYPNPFSEMITIEYELFADEYMNISIYAVDGTFVATLANEEQMAGEYSYKLNAAEYGLKPGAYFVNFRSGNTVYMKKILLIK